MARTKTTVAEQARRASEIVTAAENGQQRIGYQANFVASVALPYREPPPGTGVWVRRNGDVMLTITPGGTVTPDGKEVSFGFPYGTMPRLLLAWLSTQAVRTQSPVIDLGGSLRGFLAELGLKATGGKNGSITRLREQARRLFEASLTVRLTGDDQRDAGIRLLVAKQWDMKWQHVGDPNQAALLRSSVELSRDFFDHLIKHPVPIDLEVLKHLKDSALAMDLYTWLTYRFSRLPEPTTVPWAALRGQLGFQLADDAKGHNQMVRTVTTTLGKVRAVYPHASVEPTKAGLYLTPSRTSVPFRGLGAIAKTT